MSYYAVLLRVLTRNYFGIHHVYVELFLSEYSAIFGRSLEETLHFEMVRDPRRKVPEIVQVCTDYILKKGLTEEGIFRWMFVLLHLCVCAYIIHILIDLIN